MSYSRHCDIAILGGGLAGLSLAAELSAPEFAHLNVLVIEPRQEYVRDKTWSYWRQVAHKFSHIEAANWQVWQVQYAGKQVKMEAESADNFVYASIASDDFYIACLGLIDSCQHVSLLQGVVVENITTGEKNCTNITLTDGACVVVQQTIFDSRPAVSNEVSHLTQHFMGLQVTTQSPTFDVNTVDLMDFKDSLHETNAKNTAHGVHFMYVLPYSATEALIESTWICHHHHHADYAKDLYGYIATRWPEVKFEVKYTETGSLPLITSKHHRWKPYRYWLAGLRKSHVINTVPMINIGTRAGTARAATGYAFLETLADSARLSNLIKKNLPLTAFKRNKMDAWMDSLFLSFLGKQPTLAPHYFVQMFANCQPARLIRFLTGQASLLDRLSVIRAVPAWPMLKHLIWGSK